MKIAYFLLFIFIATCLGASVRLAKDTNSGEAAVYISSCSNTGYYKCYSDILDEVLPCERMNTDGELDETDAGAILQLAEAKDACYIIDGDFADIFVMTLYGEPTTVRIERIDLEDILNGAEVVSFCNALSCDCDDEQVYGRHKDTVCRTPGWGIFSRYGQLIVESSTEQSRCATYVIEAEKENPNEGLVHGGFNCGGSCPDFLIPRETLSLSFPSTFNPSDFEPKVKVSYVEER